MYFGPLCYGYALNCLRGDTKDTPVIYEKAKLVCFIYIQSQEMNFTSAQINMTQVS